MPNVPGLWLFFLAVTFPLIFWLGMIVKSLWDGPAERRREDQRLREIVAFRQRYVGLAQSDAGAHEALGDALRSQGHAWAALEAFLEAERLAQEVRDGRPEGGPLEGFGLQAKIRLTRLEIAQTERPGDFGMTMATRDVLCPLCKNLSPTKTLDCPHCGHPMPVDTFAEAFNHTTFRTSVLTDTRNFAWKLLLLGVAIACALAIPDPALQAATIFAAVLVLAFLLLKRIGNPES